MKNYEEKEKKLENVLNKLNTLSNKVIKMNEHINFLNNVCHASFIEYFFLGQFQYFQ